MIGVIVTSAVCKWRSTGIALTTAAVLAAAPMTAPSNYHVPAATAPVAVVQVPGVQLSATIFDILTLPVVRQMIRNRVDDIVTLGAGFAQSGVAILQSIATIPGVLVTATQQVLNGDLVGALNTITGALLSSAAAVVTPTLNAIIERRTRYLEATAALQSAVPVALVQFGNGVLSAINGVLEASIVGTQGVIQAILPLNLAALAQAVVGGAQLVGGALVSGAHDLIDGTAAAQQTLADALRGIPPMVMLSSQREATSTIATVPDLVADNVTPVGFSLPSAGKPATPSADPVTATDGENSKSVAETPPASPADLPTQRLVVPKLTLSQRLSPPTERKPENGNPAPAPGKPPVVQAEATKAATPNTAADDAPVQSPSSTTAGVSAG